MAWLDENRPEIAATIRSRRGSAASGGWASPSAHGDHNGKPVRCSPWISF